MKNSVEILHYETVLNENEIDAVSQRVYDDLRKAGLDTREALSYRILTEEKLMACMADGMRNERMTVSLHAKPDDYHVTLKVGGEERDIFTLPMVDDSFSEQIFQNVLRNIQL